MNARALRDFDALTRRGRQGRLRALALAALRDYDIDVKRCSFAAEAFNTVFRVDAADGRAYALRMSPSLRIHADGCEDTEAAWVTALRRDAGFPTPAVIPARDGSMVVAAALPGVPGVRTCVLFEWVRGGRLRDAISAARVRRTGELTAILHEHAVAHTAELSHAGALVADRVCYFRAADRLPSLRDTYGSTLEEAVARAQQALDALWRDPPHPPHLLHGDVQSANLMVRGDHVTVIDFQDLIWGFEVQDTAIAVVALDQQGFGPLVATFRAGYETVRPWPEADPGTVDALRAARHLNILNFGLSMGRPGLDEFVARHATPVVDWMRGIG